MSDQNSDASTDPTPVPLAASFEGTASGAAAIARRRNMARRRIKAAAHYTRLCLEIEEETGENEIEDDRREEYMYYATDAITSAYAAVEATINEFLQDAVDGDEELIKAVGQDVVESLASWWQKKARDQARRLKTLEKYQCALEKLDRQQFSEGESPYQPVDHLRKLRNALVHFDPEWSDEKDDHQAVEKRLTSRIESSPLIPSDEIEFPYGCLSFECGKWAVESAREFVAAFHERLDLQSPFADIDEIQ